MKQSHITLVLSTLIFSSTLFAAPASNVNQPFYTGAQVGYGTIDTGAISAPGSEVETTMGGLAYRIFGGYRFFYKNNFDIAAELGYLGYPKSDYHFPDFHSLDINYTGYAFDLLLNASYKFSSKLFGFGKVGMASVSQKLDVSADSNTYIDSTTTTLLPEVSIGGGYVINPQVSLTASANFILGGKSSPVNGPTQADVEKVADVTTFLVGFQYHF